MEQEKEWDVHFHFSKTVFYQTAFLFALCLLSPFTCLAWYCTLACESATSTTWMYSYWRILERLLHFYSCIYVTSFWFFRQNWNLTVIFETGNNTNTQHKAVHDFRVSRNNCHSHHQGYVCGCMWLLICLFVDLMAQGWKKKLIYSNLILSLPMTGVISCYIIRCAVMCLAQCDRM